jgi:hypothetical protein
MVNARLIEKQLKSLGFNYRGWGRSEVGELRNIILPDEEIFECVNGIYDGGFAMLLATDVRVLLVDKKPLNYLTVEDLRFDMINEIDYNHRLFGAYIKISAGETTLKFTSINQPRLRKLIGHVQLCMAEAKKKQAGHQEGQNQHLQQINQQLQSYLLAQYQQQQKLQEQLQDVKSGQGLAASLKQQPEPVRPSPELADYLYAQSLLAQHQARTGQAILPPAEPAPGADPARSNQMADLYSEGLQEVFGKRNQGSVDNNAVPEQPVRSVRVPSLTQMTAAIHHPLEVNPMSIAYSKLPMALRNRKFGRPSLHVPRHEPSAPASSNPIEG